STSGRVTISVPKSHRQRAWPFASQKKSFEPAGTSAPLSPDSDEITRGGALHGPAHGAFVHATSPPGLRQVTVPELSLKSNKRPDFVRKTPGAAWPQTVCPGRLCCQSS